MTTAVIQELHDSEINCTVETFFDGCFDVKLGDKLNGFNAETQVTSWAEVEAWLERTAIEIYPDSDFARSRPQRAP